jgi:hypothetical protein
MAETTINPPEKDEKDKKEKLVTSKPVKKDPTIPDFEDPLLSDTAKAWKQAFFENKSLIHVDLSHNNFKKHEAFLMGKFDCLSIR